VTENPENITLIPERINGVSEADAEHAATVGQLASLEMHHQGRAAACARLQRLLSIENPRVRRLMLNVEFGSVDAELIHEIGEFRETPFGVLGGGSDRLSRIEFRARQRAEQRQMTDDETYRNALETKRLFGTPAEQREAEDELDRLDAEDVASTDIDP
jgi:hypothetical protein